MPDVQSINVNSLSAVHKRTLQALRRPVMEAARAFKGVREKISDLAPKVIKLFNQITAEADGVTFVEFVRMFDATVPQHAGDRDGNAGYRNHPTYYTLDYMRRVVRQQTQQPRRGQQGVRDTATDALARTLATVMQLVSDPEDVWNAIQVEFAYSERLLTRLRKRVDATKPLVKLSVKTPAKVGEVIHMESIAQEQKDRAETGAGEPMAQPGQRVTIRRNARGRAA